jgi:copper chaperone NosL
MVLLTAAAVLSAGCERREAPPAELDTGNELCGSCRMPVSDPRLAGQIAAPGREPRFFDDLGCLADEVARGPQPERTVLYVADHRTRQWVRADQAVFTHCPSVETPMGSHILAHADAQSRDQDPAARAGTPVDFGDRLRFSGPATSRGSTTPARRAGEVRP